MLGKRISRVYVDQSGNLPNKQKKLEQNYDQPSSQTTQQSKCLTPINLPQSQGNEESKSTIFSQDKKPYSRRELIQEMLCLLIDEFNCNHQADLDSDNQVDIFVRDQEQKVIKKFFSDNQMLKKSGLMYLCGHPGTGKTSTLNLVLSKMKQDIKTNLINPIEVFMYNAMTFSDVKSFCFQLLEDITKRLTGQELKEKLNRSKIDDERLSQQIAELLKNNKTQTHKILVIDEIDCFQSNEKSFLTFVKALLKTNCNTSVVGIANSVDLPFKKKHSALAMRDIQILFQPYNVEQIQRIIEEKYFKKFNTFPMRLSEVKEDFFELFEEKAIEMIARKVARMNGDVRVAFDLIKTCFNKIFYQVKHVQKENDIKAKLTIDYVIKVFEEKYGSKLKETLKTLPRQDIIVLEAISTLFDDIGEEKQVGLSLLFDEVERECKSRAVKKLDLKEILNCIDELEYYSLIHVEKSKKEIKNSKFSLKCELTELIKELYYLAHPEALKKEESPKKEIDEQEDISVIKVIDIIKPNKNEIIQSRIETEDEDGGYTIL